MLRHEFYRARFVEECAAQKLVERRQSEFELAGESDEIMIGNMVCAWNALS